MGQFASYPDQTDPPGASSFLIKNGSATEEVKIEDLPGKLKRNIIMIINGGGAVITTGEKGFLRIPFACTINKVTLLADVSGSIVIDIWKDTFANYPPTVADTITAAAKPTITTAVKSEDSTLTGWTTSISIDDILKYNVDSVTSIKEITIILTVTMT